MAPARLLDGKKILIVDDEPDILETLTDLLRKADILLESFRPGVLARLGFDRDRLEAINSGLIHCH